MAATKIDYRAILEVRIENLKSVISVLDQNSNAYWDAISRLDELETIQEFVEISKSV